MKKKKGFKIILLDIPTTPAWTNNENASEFGLSSNLRDHYFKQRLSLQVLPPEQSYTRGLLTIASILRAEGAQVIYLNSDSDRDYRKKLLAHAFDSDWLMATAKTPIYPEVLSALHSARTVNENLFTVLGGAHPTALPKETVSEDVVDVVVCGEGEAVVRDLYLSVRDSRSLESVPGLVIKIGGRVICTKPATLIKDLDTVPFPAYDLLPGGISSFSAYLESSRGCPFECAFCFGSEFWKRRVRTRSYNNLVKELKFLSEYLPQGSLVHFTDAQWGMSTPQRYLLAQLARDQRDFPFIFEGNIRSNIVTPKIIEDLYAAGFRCLSLGVETLYEPTLQTISKHCTVQQHLKACQMIKDRHPDLFLKAYVIVGLPGETLFSLKATNDGLRDLLMGGLIDQLTVFIFVPYPGSPAFRDPARYGLTILTHNWRSYQDRTYPPIIRYNELNEEDIYTAFLEINRTDLYHKAHILGV